MNERTPASFLPFARAFWYSFIATIAGILLASFFTVVWLWLLDDSPTLHVRELLALPLVLLTVAAFGSVLAIPAGLLLGVPLLIALGPRVGRHRVAYTLCFGLTGFGASLAMEKLLLDFSPLEGIALVFGTCIGAMHGVACPRASGQLVMPDVAEA